MLLLKEMERVGVTAINWADQRVPLSWQARVH